MVLKNVNYTTNKANLKNDGVKFGVKLNTTQEKILTLITEDANISTQKISEIVGVTKRAIEKILVH